MKTVLVPGVGWPSHPIKVERVKLQRGGHKVLMSKEEVQRIRTLRAEGKTLWDLQQIFKRGKVTLISIIFGRGAYAGY